MVSSNDQIIWAVLCHEMPITQTTHTLTHTTNLYTFQLSRTSFWARNKLIQRRNEYCKCSNHKQLKEHHHHHVAVWKTSLQISSPCRCKSKSSALDRIELWNAKYPILCTDLYLKVCAWPGTPHLYTTTCCAVLRVFLSVLLTADECTIWLAVKVAPTFQL